MDQRGRDDEEAFRAFVETRQDALVRTALLLTGDRGHAEDLVQSALLRTYGALRRGAAPDSLEAYTRTVMIRLCLRWRSVRWRGESVRPVAEDHGALSTSTHADASVDAVAIRRALMSLPAAQRAVLVLRYYEGLSETEIAELLHISAGTVKSRSSRALAALRAGGLLDDTELPEDHHARS